MDEQIERGNGKVVFWIIMVSLLVAGVMLVWQFIPAILWAVVLSVLLYPWYKKSRQRFAWSKHQDTLASLWVTLFTAFAIIVPLLGLLAIGSAQVYNFANELVADSGDGRLTIQNLAVEIDSYLIPIAESVGVRDFSFSRYIEENRSQITQSVYGPIFDGAKRFVMMVVTLVIAFLTTFFMLRDGHRALEPAVELIPLPRDKSVEILQKIASTIRSVFYSVVVVALIQGLMCLVLYWAFGVPSPFAWWALTTLLAMIPLLGAPVAYIPASALLILTGHPVQGIAMLAICFIFVSNIDNILRPYFISMGSNLHMIAIFFALIGGVFTLGPIGLMVGPMLLTLLLGMLDVLRERRRLLEEQRA